MTILEANHDPRYGSMIRHAQTVITGLILAVLVWIGQSVSDGRVEIAALRERIEHLSRRVDELGIDRYRAADAQRDFALRDQAIHRTEQRVTRLEENLDHHGKTESGKR